MLGFRKIEKCVFVTLIIIMHSFFSFLPLCLLLPQGLMESFRTSDMFNCKNTRPALSLEAFKNQPLSWGIHTSLWFALGLFCWWIVLYVNQHLTSAPSKHWLKNGFFMCFAQKNEKKGKRKKIEWKYAFSICKHVFTYDNGFI